MFFINIDGPNGAGKSTFIKEVVKNIQSKRPDLKIYVQHFHRRDTLIGQTIQKVLNGEYKIDTYALQHLYSVDRLDFTKIKYKELFKSYDVLISDRYNTSSIAYGMSQYLDTNILIDFDKYCVKPDKNIILNATVPTLISRLKTAKLNEGETSDIFEQESKLIKIVAAFDKLVDLIPNCIKLDVTNGVYTYIDYVSDIIIKGVKK